MNEIGIGGMTVTKVSGCGVQKGQTSYYRGAKVNMELLPKLKVEVVVSEVPVADVVKAAKKALYTGNIGDGKSLSTMLRMLFVSQQELVAKMH